MVAGAPPQANAIGQGQKVAHIVCRRGPGHAALGIPSVIDPVRIGNYCPVLLGQGIESCAVKHGGPALGKTVENQDQRQGIGRLGTGRHINLCGSNNTTVQETQRGCLGVQAKSPQQASHGEKKSKAEIMDP